MTTATQNNIILSAAAWAGVGELTQEEIDKFRYVYEQELKKLLERRNTWRFLTDMIPRSEFTLVEGSKNLGYTYAYKGPSRILSVMAIDPQVKVPPVDYRRAVDYGYSISYDYRGGDPTSDFVFVGGELYTDNDNWETAVVQYKVDEADMPTHFVEALTFKMAAFIAFSSDQNRGKYAELNKKAEEAYLVAQDDLRPKSPGQIYEETLLAWIYKYNYSLNSY